MITLAKAICGRSARKTFVDYKQEGNFLFPWKFQTIEYFECEDENLDIIKRWTKLTEDNDLPYLIFTGTIKDNHIGKIFKRTKEYFDPLGKTSIGQGDFDGRSIEKVNLNSSDIHERLDYLETVQPLLTGLGVVAHVSNKAFLPYPEYEANAALRVWFQLTEPLTKNEWKQLLKPHLQNRGEHDVRRFDGAMFSFNSPHFIRPPLLLDDKGNQIPRPIIGETLIQRPGRKLDVAAIQSTQEWKTEKANTDAFNSSITNHTSFEETADLVTRLGEEGYFENNRHIEHFKLISKAIWVHKNERPIIELIASDKNILGENRTKQGLQDEADGRHAHFRNYWECYDVNDNPPLASKTEWDWKNCIDELDLADANLDDLKAYLESVNFKTILNVQSAHGTGKTVGIIQRAKDWLADYLKRPTRILYICYRTSNVYQAAHKLQIPCYIEEDGKIVASFVASQKELAICLHSLGKLYTRNFTTGEYERHIFDLMVIDESESNALDAQWNNGNHDYLIELGKQTRMIIQLDADLGELSFGYATAIANTYGHQMSYLFNRATHIAGKTFYALEKEIDALIAIDGCLDNGDRIFVHCDFADPKLASIAHYFNIKHKRTIAISLDAASARLTRNRGIISDPDTFLKARLEEGVQLFLVSPTIETGWRYGGVKNFDGLLFDTTIGIYTYARHTAPQILQASQRVVGASTQFIYAPLKCSHLDIDELDRQYMQATMDELQSEEEIHTKEKLTALLSYSQDVAYKADVKKRKQLSNVMLHLQYLIADYGAYLEYLDPYYEKEEHSWLKHLVKASEEELIRDEAERVFSDYETRTELEHFFYVCKALKEYEEHPFTPENFADKRPIENIEECEALLKRRYRVEKEAANIYELLQVALASPQERQRWGSKPYWKLNVLDKPPTNGEKGIAHYTQYGAILDIMIQNIWEQTGVHLINDLLIRKIDSVCIETELFRTTELVQMIDDWSDFLKNKVQAFRTKGTEETYLRRILTEQFDLEVSTRTIKSGLAEAKRRIIRHYMNMGIIRKTEDEKPRKNLPIVHRTIKQKTRTGVDLDDEEQLYMAHTDKLMTIRLKPETPKNLFHILWSVYNDPCRHETDTDQNVDFFENIIGTNQPLSKKSHAARTEF